MKIPSATDYIILCDRVLEHDTLSFVRKAIRVRNGQISSAEPLSRWTDDGQWEIFDLRGHILAPPLVDPHVHAYMNPWPLDPAARVLPGSAPFHDELHAARRRLEEAHLAGLGWVRDLGDPQGINLAIAEEARVNTALPRVVAAGCAVYREGRYGRFIGKAVPDREGLCRAVMRLVNDPAVDLVKLIPTGIVNFRKGRVSSAPQFSTDDLRAAVDVAHEHGRMVAAHCSGEPGIRSAVEAGVDFIEHGYFIERATMDLLAEKGLVWTPTFAPVHAQWKHAGCCGWDEETTANIRAILDGHFEMLEYARGTGAKIVAGSDAGSPGVPHGGGLIRELELMEEAGMPAEELLAMATTRAACWIQGEKPSERFVPGAPADFIAVSGDFRKGISSLRNIEWVARAGIVRKGRRARMESDDGAETYGHIDAQPGGPRNQIFAGMRPAPNIRAVNERK